MLQAVTLVAAVWGADVRGGTRLAALVAVVAVVASTITWVVPGRPPAGPRRHRQRPAGGRGARRDRPRSATSNREDQLYFSFVTLCTVGYGDLTPAGGLARSFSVAEMLAGQIYLVTIVSLIVSNLGAARRR